MAQHVGYYSINNRDVSYYDNTVYKDKRPTKKEFGIDKFNDKEIEDVKKLSFKRESIREIVGFIYIIWTFLGIPVVIILLKNEQWYYILVWLFGIVALRYLSYRKYSTENIYERIKQYEMANHQYNWWQKRKKMDFWFSLNGREFEIEIANIFKKMDYQIILCKQGGDKGIDIEIFKNGIHEIIQCKAHKNKVSPSVARDLYGTMNANSVKKAYLITLNGATSGTIDFCRKHNIEIWDIDDILRHQDEL